MWGVSPKLTKLERGSDGVCIGKPWAVPMFRPQVSLAKVPMPCHQHLGSALVQYPLGMTNIAIENCDVQ